MQIKVGNSENQMTQANLQTQEKAAAAGGRKAAVQQKKTAIFAGELPLHKDPIALRRQQAQKKAMKFVQDAWGTDRKVDQSMEQMREIREMLREEVQSNVDQAQELADRREGLREQYGVDAESQEQKDLELLLRAVPPYDYDSRPFTDEEMERLAELEEQPRTEYQEHCIALYKDQKVFEQRARQAEDNMIAVLSSQTDMKIERLKYHKMSDAQKKAEKVMAESGREIQGMLVDDAKDHVDETYEEKREEEEKKKEEKEAEEEKIELRREQKELMEARIEEVRAESHDAQEVQRAQERDAREEASFLKDMAEAGMNVAGAGNVVKAEIKDILNKMKLIEADIKGIEVDEEI